MKILKLDPSYDLWLSYAWFFSDHSHEISGHLFEVLDYYYILKKHFKVGILMGDGLKWEDLCRVIMNRYNFTNDEIMDIKSNTVFSYKPRAVYCKNILFTDGQKSAIDQIVVAADNIIHFACGDITLQDNKKDTTWILQDKRIYEECHNSINYKKKILFNRLKIPTQSTNDYLLYITNNCRFMDLEQVLEMMKEYGDNTYRVLSFTPEIYVGFDNIMTEKLPIENIFEKFQTYIYTKVPRKWDCSSRLICECKYLGKDVIYHNIDYWDEDLGLKWRKWDVDNDFNSLYLRDDDELIEILKTIIE